MLSLQYFYIIFTTNYKWLVVIGSNLKLTLRLRFYPNNNNQKQLATQDFLQKCYEYIISKKNYGAQIKEKKKWQIDL